MNKDFKYMTKKFDLKLEDNKIMWWNGIKWLVKETCVELGATKANIIKAKKRIKELEK